MKKRFLIILSLSIMILLVACNNTSKEADSNHTKLAVSVSFNAMAEFTKAVGKDKVDVSVIIPAGTEPHDFEPKAADIAKLSKASVFVYNGLGMENWVDKAIEAADNNKLIIIDSSINCDLIKTNEDEHESDHEDADEHSDEEEHEEEEDGHHHGEYDPHLWLSLKNAQIQVQNIADGLSNADPDNKTFYQENATEYIEQLNTLYEEYKDKFASLENKHFVTGHAAFNYFCRDFGLEQNSVEDVFSEGEPSSKQLAELVEYCKEHNVKTIFAEEMASPLVSQTLANEVGAEVQTIHTIESPEDEMTYLERMKDNCEKIYQSLSK